MAESFLYFCGSTRLSISWNIVLTIICLCRTPKAVFTQLNLLLLLFYYYFFLLFKLYDITSREHKASDLRLPPPCTVSARSKSQVTSRGSSLIEFHFISLKFYPCSFVICVLEYNGLSRTDFYSQLKLPTFHCEIPRWKP